MTANDPVSTHPVGVVIDLYVLPRASRTELAGTHNGALRIRITAPPVDGAANDEIIDFLRKQLSVRKVDIEILSGATGRRKRVLMYGVTPTRARERLGLSAT